VRTFRSADDLAAGGWERFRRLVLGSEPDATVFNPTNLVLSPDDRTLYVACTSTAKVLAIDLVSGRFSRVATEEGHQFKNPYGLATDADGNLYVSDQVDALVRVFSPRGSFLRDVGKGKFSRPSGMAIDRKRQLLYVADGGRYNDASHKIEVFSLAGQHLRTIGGRGTDPGQFNFPSYLTVSPNGMLYVADTLNFRVQVFDPDGNLVGFFGKQGDSEGGFNRVKGMAFDALGLLHVADSGNSMVQVFNANHLLLLFYGGGSSLPGFMQAPDAIAIDSKNNIFVADFMANSVLQYVLFNTTAADVAASLEGRSIEETPVKTGGSEASPTPTR